MDPYQLRRLGRTNLHLPAAGLGTATIGDMRGAIPEAQALVGTGFDDVRPAATMTSVKRAIRLALADGKFINVTVGEGNGQTYVGFDGDMDLNIAIRTLVQRGDYVYTWAGGGVVADSNVDAEYQESFDKAGAMLAVLEAQAPPS